MAKESDNSDDIRAAVKQVIQNCCLDDINIDSLPLFDIEMFFVHLRMKSIGESVKLQFKCENLTDAEANTVCGKTTEFSMDLNKVHYELPENSSDTIKLSDKVGIKLKYPSMDIFKEEVSEDEYENALKIIINNIVCVYDEDSIYKRESISDDELKEFLDQLTIEQIDQIRTFFASIPRVVLEDEMTCGKCGFVHKIKAGDLYNFFT